MLGLAKCDELLYIISVITLEKDVHQQERMSFKFPQVYYPQSPRPAHRLDANTTGLVLFARTKHFAKRIQRQFESGHPDEIEKEYLAKVHGHPCDDEFTCTLPITDEPGPLGSRGVDIVDGVVGKIG